MNKNMHLTVSAPTVVTQGETYAKVGWGRTQFPGMNFTDKGYICMNWSISADDMDSYTDSPGFAVSEDGGKTWRQRRPNENLLGFVKMPNGKIFHGFTNKNREIVDYMHNYTPVYENISPWDGDYALYLADDIKELDRSIIGCEYDPIRGEYNNFQVKLNWHNMAVVVYGGDKLFPISQVLSMGGSINTILIDGVLYMCTYTKGVDPETGKPMPYSSHCAVWVLYSDDNARTWNYLSHIPVTEDIFVEGRMFDGLCEPKMRQMPDGSIVMIMRSGRNQPSYITHSTDNCKTWEKPEVFDKVGVLPQILTLDCGVTLASYGRDGIFVRATADRAARKWEAPIEIDIHGTPPDNSCCYTALLPLSANTALLAYSDFYYPDTKGVPRKTILVRTLAVEYK